MPALVEWLRDYFFHEIKKKETSRQCALDWAIDRTPAKNFQRVDVWPQQRCLTQKARIAFYTLMHYSFTIEVSEPNVAAVNGSLRSVPATFLSDII